MKIFLVFVKFYVFLAAVQNFFLMIFSEYTNFLSCQNKVFATTGFEIYHCMLLTFDTRNLHRNGIDLILKVVNFLEHETRIFHCTSFILSSIFSL